MFGEGTNKSGLDKQVRPKQVMPSERLKILRRVGLAIGVPSFIIISGCSDARQIGKNFLEGDAPAPGSQAYADKKAGKTTSDPDFNENSGYRPNVKPQNTQVQPQTSTNSPSSEDWATETKRMDQVNKDQQTWEIIQQTSVQPQPSYALTTDESKLLEQNLINCINMNSTTPENCNGLSNLANEANKANGF